MQFSGMTVALSNSTAEGERVSNLHDGMNNFFNMKALESDQSERRVQMRREQDYQS